jgi:hypothetical protein
VRISWSRRIGAALALLALGGSIVLAGQALDDGVDPASRPSAGPSREPLPPAPVVGQPAQTLIAATTIDLDVQLAGGLAPRSAYRLRIYVNDELVREQRLPRDEPALLTDVPLQPGDNWISVAVWGPAGESLHSAAVHVVRDDEPPPIHVSAPTSRNVYTRQVVLRGRTEAGARLIVRNPASDENYELDVGGDARFEIQLNLAMGENVITLRAIDAAGNRSRATVRLVRLESSAAVTLEARPATLKLEDLPATVTLQARITGLRGEPVDGAQVTFSISVPGQQTSTYQTTSHAGLAVWRGVRIPRDGAREGHGLATVMVVLGDGLDDELTLQESASIVFR